MHLRQEPNRTSDLQIQGTVERRQEGSGTPPRPFPPLLLPLSPSGSGGRGGALLDAEPAPSGRFLSRRGGTVADATVDDLQLCLVLRLPLLLRLLLLRHLHLPPSSSILTSSRAAFARKRSVEVSTPSASRAARAARPDGATDGTPAETRASSLSCGSAPTDSGAGRVPGRGRSCARRPSCVSQYSSMHLIQVAGHQGVRLPATSTLLLRPGGGGQTSALCLCTGPTSTKSKHHAA